MKNRQSLPACLAAGAVAAALCTLLVDGGWLAWIPTLLALLVAGGLRP